MLMVEMLARMPDLRRRIYVDHVSDGAGYCRDCQGARWPCELVQLAAEADRRDGVTPGYLTPPPRGAGPVDGRGTGSWSARGPAGPPPARVDRRFPAGSPPAAMVDHRAGYRSAQRAGFEPERLDVASPPIRAPGAAALPEPRSTSQRLSYPDEPPRRDQLRIGSDELRARREEARARREQLRARRNGRAPSGDGLGRHDFGREAAAGPYPGSGGPLQRADVVDALEDVLRWSP
jgi:hypothetical protein